MFAVGMLSGCNKGSKDDDNSDSEPSSSDVDQSDKADDEDKTSDSKSDDSDDSESDSKSDDSDDSESDSKSDSSDDPESDSKSDDSGSSGGTDATASSVGSSDHAQDDNMVPDFQGDSQKELNIFLSNFSEAFFAEGTPYTEYDSEKLISFAFIHNIINNNGVVQYANDEMSIDGETIAQTVNKYFNVKLKHESVSDYTYRNGRYYTTAATGENYSYCSIVDEMYDNGDGTYDVHFVVYSGPADTKMEPYYVYSHNSAENDSSLTPDYSGKAVIGRKDKGGYYLISYTKL